MYLPMRIAPLLILLAAALAAPASSAAQATDPGGPLVYVFVLDALDGDRVDAGVAPYLQSLVRGEQGARTTYFRESRSIMIAETNPNHVAMATGAYGSTSGIPGNSFAVYGPTANGDSCALTGPRDESKPPTPVSGESPDCLKAETFFEAAQRGPGADGVVTAGIFGKPKLSRIFAGKKTDPSRFDADYLWTPCLEPSDDVPYCKQVPNRGFDEYSILDSTVMDEVLRTTAQGVPGDGKTFMGGNRRPNLTFVNFPAIDNSGHATGAGPEYDNAIVRADQQVQRFVEQQKRLGLWDRTVMVLLSDHSMDSTPQKTSLDARFRAAGISSGDYDIVQNGSAALVYLTNRTDDKRFAKLKAMRAAAVQGAPAIQPFGPPAVEALYREPNPEDGLTANTLDSVHPGWRLAGPETADLVVTAASTTSFNDPINPLAGNHGGPQTRDNFLAVVGGSPMVNQRVVEGAQDPLFDDTLRNPAQAENVDVAATALRLLGRPAPAQNQGRVLEEAFDPGRLAAIPVVPTSGTAAAGRPAGGTGAGGTRPGAVPVPVPAPASCAAGTGFRAASVRGAGRGLRVSLSRRTPGAASFDLFQVSRGSRILGNRRVARVGGRRSSFTYRGRGLRDGVFFARLRIAGTDGRADERRFAVERRGGRFRVRPTFARAEGCGPVRLLKAERPVFGGRSNRALNVAYALGTGGRTTITLLRGGRTVRRLGTSDRSANRVFRLRIGAERLRRGDYSVRVTVVGADGRATTSSVTARRL